MKIKYPSLLLALVIGVSGCAKDEYGNTRPMTDAEKGALIGAAVGAGIGLTQRNKHGNKAVVIGAVGGGIAGGLVGNYMDSQKKDLQKVLAPEIIVIRLCPNPINIRTSSYAPAIESQRTVSICTSGILRSRSTTGISRD